MKAVLPAALAASVSRHPVIVPHINAAEAALVRACDVIAARHILDVCAHLRGTARTGVLPRRVAFIYPDSVARSIGCSRPAACQTRLGDCRRWSTQSADDWTAGGREEHARTTIARYRAAAERRGGHGGGRAALDCGSSVEAERVARTAISQSASHGLGGGTGRRRCSSAPGRDFLSLITASSSSMNCRSSSDTSLKYFGNRWNWVPLRFRVQRSKRNSQRVSSLIAAMKPVSVWVSRRRVR